MCTTTITLTEPTATCSIEFISEVPQSPDIEKSILRMMDTKRKLVDNNLKVNCSNKKARIKEPEASDGSTLKSFKASLEGTNYFNEMDVLSGRGGGTNLHPGNRHYRELILAHRTAYDLASKSKKPGVSREIVQLVREKGGRFLRKEKDGLFYDIGDDLAREKTSQALRHRTFEMRNKEDPNRSKDKACPKRDDDKFGPPSKVLREPQMSKAKPLVHPPSNATHFRGREHPSLHQKVNQDVLAEQRRVANPGESVYLDRAYLRTLYALRQTEAVMDLNNAMKDAHMCMSLASSMPFPSRSLGVFGMNRSPLPHSLGLPAHLDPSLLIADRMAISLGRSSASLRGDSSDTDIQSHMYLHTSFFPQSRQHRTGGNDL